MRTLAATRAVAPLVAFVVAGMFATTTATASPPSIVHVGPIAGAATIPAGMLCSFPIEDSYVQEYTSRNFYDDSGALVKRVTQGSEQDNLSANGRTLASDTYTFRFISEFENGVRVASYSDGVAVRVPLPSGGVFILAGRVLLTRLEVFYMDFGNDGTAAGRAEAFCEALTSTA